MIILVTTVITNNLKWLKCNEHITLPYVVMFKLTAWPLILHKVFWQRFFLSGYFVSNSKAALKKVEFGALTEKMKLHQS